jgi:hypothetical protein
MLTRSQTLKQQKNKDRKEYEVNIDFDEASREWKANKKSTKNGCYKYVCIQITKSGNQCKRESEAGYDFCKCHNKIKK